MRAIILLLRVGLLNSFAWTFIVFMVGIVRGLMNRKFLPDGILKVRRLLVVS